MQPGDLFVRFYGSYTHRFSIHHHLLPLLVLHLVLGSWLIKPPVAKAQPWLPPNAQPTTQPDGLQVPTAANVSQQQPLTVNPQSREESRQLYEEYYLPGESALHGWNGNVATCQAGEVTAAFRTAILQRINYFRAMAGVPATVTWSADYNRQAQQAALMMSANRRLSHTPTPDWQCYSEEGDTAAGSANLFLGVFGPAAIDGYIEDPGDGNFFAGHRRWILYPQTQLMGVGDIPGQGSQAAANALWVFDHANMWGPRPATREAFVAWPPPGFVPAELIFPRWSFAYAGADFSQTTVTVIQNGVAQPVQLAPLRQGFGENTLVWEMPTLQAAQQPLRADAESSFITTVDNVLIDGVMRSFSYSVISFNPTLPSPQLTPVAYLPMILGTP